MTNSAPVANPTSGSTNEETALIIAANFTDPDSADSHTFSVNTTGTAGSVTNNNDGTFSYDPTGAFDHLAVGETTTDTFNYTVDDGNGGTSTATVTVTITGQNDAVAASAVTATVSEDTASTISASFTDPDASDTHTFSIDSTGTLGTVTNNNDGTFGYDPNGQFEHLAVGETATDTFTYTVDDGNGSTSTKTVTVTITGQNDAPVATALTGSASEDGPAITVTASYSDIDSSDSHTFSVNTTGTAGSVTNNNDGTFSYDPAGAFDHLAAGEATTDTFSYTVDDGNGGTSTATVTVTITGQNDAVAASAVTATVSEDTANTISASFTDPDASDTHTFSIDTTGTLGTVTNNNDGTFSYDPNGQFEYLAVGETATDTFTYTVTDSQGSASTETVAVTLTGQNDAPVAIALSGSAHEDGPAVTLAASYTDIDSQGPFVITIDTTGTLGSVTNNGDGTFSYHANGQFEHLNKGDSQTDTFTYTVTDNHGGSTTETVTISVEGQVDSSKLIASDGVKADFFGANSAVNDSGVVVVGAWGDDDSGSVAGAAYVYTPDSSGGYTETKLPVAGLEASDWFGYTVAINNGGTIAISAPLDDDAAQNSGAVYIFEPNQVGGYTQSKLTIPAGAFEDRSGVGLSINDNGHVAIGGLSTGEVYVFTPDGTGGYTSAQLVASDTVAASFFGYSTAVNNSGVVFAGSFGHDGAGAGYVFTPDGSGGYTETKVFSSDIQAGDNFGHSVQINSSGTLLAGAYGEDDTGNNAGAVYLYNPDGAGGYTETKITATDASASALFGFRVALNDSGVAVVGARDKDSKGAAYVYVPKEDGSYTEVKLTAPDGVLGDRFGVSVDINADGVVTVGAEYGDGNVVNSGTVYTYVPDINGNYVGYDGTVYTGVSANSVDNGPASLTVTGTSASETLAGGSNDDTIDGGAGSDTLTGGAGDDVLTGGSGNDTFVFHNGETGHDTLTDFSAGIGATDVVQFETAVFADFASVLAASADSGSDLVITIDSSTSITLQGVQLAGLDQDDFQFV